MAAIFTAVVNLLEKIIKKDFDLEGKTDDEKAKEIINYVKSRYTWNGYFGKVASQSVKSFLKNEKGSVADINLWLIALLNAAGLEAKPIALATRKHGKINMQYPFHRDFNYMVVLVTYDGKQYLTDGSEKYLAYNKIPPHCINEKGLVIDNGKGGWVRLDNGIVSKDNKLMTIDVDAKELTASANVTIQGSEYNAYLYKQKWEDTAEKIEETMLKSGFTNIDQVKTFNFSQNTKPYIVAFKGAYEVDEIGGKIIVAPFLQYAPKSNPLKQNKRLYLIDFTYLSADAYKSQINMPEGYTVRQLPDSIAIDDDIIKIELYYQQSGKQIIVEGFHSFKQTIYQAEDYQKLKGYFELIVSKFNQEIIFEPL